MSTASLGLIALGALSGDLYIYDVAAGEVQQKFVSLLWYRWLTINPLRFKSQRQDGHKRYLQKYPSAFTMLFSFINTIGW